MKIGFKYFGMDEMVFEKKWSLLCIVGNIYQLFSGRTCSENFEMPSLGKTEQFLGN